MKKIVHLIIAILVVFVFEGSSQKAPNQQYFDSLVVNLETLGEEVRKKVFQDSGIELQWEIMRVGEPTPEKPK